MLERTFSYFKYEVLAANANLVVEAVKAWWNKLVRKRTFRAQQGCLFLGSELALGLAFLIQVGGECRLSPDAPLRASVRVEWGPLQSPAWVRCSRPPLTPTPPLATRPDARAQSVDQETGLGHCQLRSQIHGPHVCAQGEHNATLQPLI